MPITAKQALGAWGEEEAVKLLESKGFTILERNWRCKRAEIDIIAKNEQYLIFVEVKVRKNTQFGFPEEFVKPPKIQLIRTASEQFQINCSYSGFIRFDIISVEGNPSRFEIVHIEDAF